MGSAIVVLQNDQTLENRVMHGDASIDQDGLVTVVSPTMFVAFATLSAAQVRTLFSAPRILVPAPGVGKCVIVFDVTYYMVYGGVAFDVGSNVLDVVYRGSLPPPTITDDEYSGAGVSKVLSQTVTNSALCYSAEGGLGYVLPLAVGENKDVLLHLRDSDMTVGNSTLKVRVRYQIIDTTF